MRSTHFILSLILLFTVELFATDDEIDVLLDETEAYLFELESESAWLDEILEEPSTESQPTPTKWDLWSSLTLGGGYTDNVYLGSTKLESGYATISGDFLATYFPKANWVAQLYAYAQWKGYEGPESINDEWIALTQLSFQRYFSDWILALELNDFYADQFFDATQSSFDLPTGSRVINHQPSLALRATYSLFEHHKLIASVKGVRAELSVEEYNQWNFGGAIKWEAMWTPSVTTYLELSAEEQHSDHQTLRDELGANLNNTLLVKQIGDIEASLKWDLGTRFDITLNLAAGYRILSDNGSQYESYDDYYGELEIEAEIAQVGIELSGEMSTRTYNERRWDRVLPGLLQRDRESINLELSRAIGWDIEARVQVSWERLRSQIQNDNFTATRYELSIRKSF